ncbi:hypothetical protein I5M27_05215 [Adhaeribacter sp. BT258]|uniref:Uncharacterized protein n=1 Tax=Adhaeribacter terrigena TaxID=2793070 RepID=A0ABS1BYX4_9BACT|nr:hypothetical protein [Adhaeribacter terrigena]MBK0402373.1 hypothetical protein [Adhaeribacter terrigena]
MKILYAITFCAKNKPGAGLLQKMKLVAKDQVEAVKLASQKAEVLNLEVIRVEELERVKQEAVSMFTEPEFKEELRQ